VLSKVVRCLYPFDVPRDRGKICDLYVQEAHHDIAKPSSFFKIQKSYFEKSQLAPLRIQFRICLRGSKLIYGNILYGNFNF
jgi:hypothetical protein